VKLEMATRLGKAALAGGAAAALLVCATPAQARVTRIIVDRVTQGPNGPLTANYQSFAGRAFGELDPNDPHNTIITDINFGKDPDGKVRYVTSFFIVAPKDLSQASGFLWHDVPNRGGRITIVAPEQALGDIGLSSGWQSDNAGATAVPANAGALTPQPTLVGNEWVLVPVAKNADGSSITGFLQARIINKSGPNSQPLNVMGNPVPYLPATLDTTQASLRARYHETVNGQITEAQTIPSSDWAFAHCDATHPFPGTPQDLNHADLPGSLPVHVCLKNGFNANLLYELVYPVKDPYVTGVGHAAFRDVNSFFRNATQDDFGTANPIAGHVRWAVIRGVSQSGNFTRAFIHLGFNQDEAGRTVHEGAWPIIAGRRVSLDTRWAQPDGVLELYQMGSEGPQWWVDWPDKVRNLPTTGILHRCTASNSCPKVIEHFGGSEVFALKMTTEWVGTSADQDIPLPDNVRRYYVSSSTHGGGNGATTQNSSPNGASCPGNSWGTGVYRGNPMPEAQLVNVLRLAMRNWLINGTPPPPSVWPRISNGTLVDSDAKAMSFPSGIPAIPPTVFDPENFTFPVFDYDWGPFFDETDATGVATNMPPAIQHVIKMKVPKVDGDGNELGGVPTVLRDVPLGTYLGWNLTSSGFHQAQVCNYVGGFIPFAVTPDQRQGPDMNVRFHASVNGKGGDWSHAEKLDEDPRPSLQERYGTHDAYVNAVRTAAANAVSQGYLLQADADALVTQAQTSDVLNSATNTSLAAYGEASVSDKAGPKDKDVNPGDTLQVGYSFNLPGKPSASTVTFGRPQIILHATCDGKKGSASGPNDVNGGPIVVTLPDASYSATGGPGWTPTNDKDDAASFQTTTTVPDVCQGGSMRIDGNATFTATVGSK
jgi:Alpha/beta hydrolase domain